MIRYPHIHTDWSDFKTNNYGAALSEVIAATVTEERNGIFDLDLMYPCDGANADKLTPGAIISSQPAPGKTAEPFRIYDVQKDINGVSSCKAHHCVYDTDGVIIAPFSVSTAGALVSALNTHLNNALADFEVQLSGIPNNTAADLTTHAPATLWSLIGAAAALLGAELGYTYDRATQKMMITLYAARGTTSTATIRWGVNLMTINGGLNNANVYTAIYPYYVKEEPDETITYVELPEKTLSTGGTGRTRILPVDLTSKFKQSPTAAQLRAEATAYINGIDWDTVNSVSFDFIPLQNTTEYAGTDIAQAVDLCDTVAVNASRIGISAAAKVVKAVYNPLLDKYENLTVGEIAVNIADTIAKLSGQVQALETQAGYKVWDGSIS